MRGDCLPLSDYTVRDSRVARNNTEDYCVLRIVTLPAPQLHQGGKQPYPEFSSHASPCSLYCVFNFSQTPSSFKTIKAPLDAAHFLNDTSPKTDPDDE
jgi:hypothetical protein